MERAMHLRRATVVPGVALATVALLALASGEAHAQRGWSGLVSTVSTEAGSTPAVTLDGDGNLTGIWGTEQKTVRASRLAAERDEWAAPVELSHSGETSRYIPQVEAVADVAGNVIAVWEWYVAQGAVVQAARYSIESGAWSPVVTVSAANADGRGALGLLADRTGNATVWWSRLDRQGPNTVYAVQAVRYSVSGGTWSAVQDLSAPSQRWPTPRAAVDDAGNVTQLPGSEVNRSPPSSRASRFSRIALRRIPAPGAASRTFPPRLSMDLKRPRISGGWLPIRVATRRRPGPGQGSRPSICSGPCRRRGTLPPHARGAPRSTCRRTSRCP